MDKKLITQFTFFDLYAKLMDSLTDEERGKMLRTMCVYMFTDAAQESLSDKKLKFLWGNISDCMNIDRQAQENGRTPKGLNRQMRHFTFYRNFYEAVELMDDKHAGQYIKAVYNYAFNEQEPIKLTPSVELYYTLAKRKLELSKIRSTVGRKGGKTERIPVTMKDIDDAQPEGLSSIGIEAFLRNHPHVKNDIYKSSLHLTEGVDWTSLDEMLSTSPYFDCTSLYKILTHQREIYGMADEQEGSK